MGDEYPDHLNPFKQRKSGIRASFRALKNTIGGRFRKKKDEHHEENTKTSGEANYSTTLRNGTLNSTVRSQTTSELFLRSRFNDRVARSQTLQFNGLGNGVRNGDSKETNPFNETDTTRTTDERCNGFVPGKIDFKSGTDTTRRRRRKKRAPLPPGGRNHLGVPREHNTSQWSIDTDTSYETDYSSATFTQSDNELNVQTDLDRLKDIQEISKEIQVFCDDNDVEVNAQAEEHNDGESEHLKITKVTANGVQEHEQHKHIEDTKKLPPPEIEISSHDEVVTSSDNVNTTVVETAHGVLPVDTSRNNEIIQVQYLEINNSGNQNDNNVEIPENSTSAEINENIKTTNTNTEETTSNDGENDAGHEESKDMIVTNNFQERYEDKNDATENVGETVHDSKLSLNGGHVDINPDELKEKEIEVCDIQNGDMSANDDNIGGQNNAANVDYVNRKSLYITGSLDDLDVVQRNETSLFITGSCDELDTNSQTPRPKCRKNKLGRETLLGSNDKVNNPSEK